MRVLGLAPVLPAHRPRAAPRWWIATGETRDGAVALTALDLADAPPPVDGIAGLAAPCSLPAAFSAWLGLEGDRDGVLAGLAAMTPNRLLRRARAFAMGRERGQRHPRRAPEESESALERRRLARFAAALPLLRTTPTVPWSRPEAPYLFEVDPPALLERLGLPHAGLAGDAPAAVRRRARVLDALREGVLGAPLDLAPARDVAIASVGALRAVLAAAAAAWLAGAGPTVPAAPAVPPAGEAWIPLPPR